MELLHNSNFVVFLAFVAFCGVLVWKKVPGIITGALDARAAKIRDEIEEARRLREEAQSLLASYERKAKEAKVHAADIVEHARAEALRAAEDAKKDLAASIERRLKGADEQIAAAEAAAMKAVKDRAVTVATEVAAQILREKLSAEARAAMVDASIADVSRRLN